MGNEKMFGLLEKFYGEFNQFKNSTETDLMDLRETTKKTAADLKDLSETTTEMKGDIRDLRETTTEMKGDIRELRETTTEMKADIKELRETTIKIGVAIETEINPKIQVLLDGHVNHSEQFNRIEKAVSRQEEVMLRKIK